MSVWLILFTILLVAFIPIHFASVSHKMLERKFGSKNGENIGKVLGMVSGWGFFIVLFGIWISPQPRFRIPFLQDLIWTIPIFNFEIPILHIIIALPLIVISIYLGIFGVKEISLEASETHKTEEIISSGVYSIVRHPQYLGAIFAHIAFSILLSGLYSLILTILVVFYNYITAWKEEKELVKEFGEEYERYKEEVPMFLPRF